MPETRASAPKSVSLSETETAWQARVAATLTAPARPRPNVGIRWSLFVVRVAL